jgi:hypothetical protein
MLTLEFSTKSKFIGIEYKRRMVLMLQASLTPGKVGHVRPGPEASPYSTLGGLIS